MSVAPLVDFMHERNAAPHGLWRVVENDDLELARRSRNGLGHGDKNLAHGFFILVAPVRLRSGFDLLSVDEALWK